MTYVLAGHTLLSPPLGATFFDSHCIYVCGFIWLLNTIDTDLSCNMLVFIVVHLYDENMLFKHN